VRQDGNTTQKEAAMSFEFVKRLPNPEEIKSKYPLSLEGAKAKGEKDAQIEDVFTRRSSKFLAIIGPCSADNETAVLDYTHRLARVQEKISDKIIIIPRIYTNKPRTTGEGYKGMLHQPDPEKAPDMLAGLIAIRKLHMDVIEQTGLPTADEMLYPENYRYLSDLLSYVAVGARSVEDQQHRFTVSGMDVPAGMKNPTSGDMSVMLNSIVAAQQPQAFIYCGCEVNTSGNPLSHAILRGAVNKHGQTIPNYHYEDLKLLFNLYSKRGLSNMAVIVDSNHSNSGKQYAEQVRIVKEVLHSRRHSSDIEGLVKGVMVESYIEPGCQKIGEGVYGKSITDPCLGWEETERLLLEMAELV
jgi:3-deoxy-7-phosphoheptulonate synthase